MKKNIYKMGIYLLIVTLMALAPQSEAYRGHHRHRHGGWGYGWGLGYPGWGYGWGAPGVTVALGGPRRVRRDIRDDMGRNYWSIINGTETPILVRTSNSGYQKIYPGEQKNIRRKGSFNIKVKSVDGQRLKLRTQQHFVEINRNPMGSLTFNAWNE